MNIFRNEGNGLQLNYSNERLFDRFCNFLYVFHFYLNFRTIYIFLMKYWNTLYFIWNKISVLLLASKLSLISRVYAFIGKYNKSTTKHHATFCHQSIYLMIFKNT